ncbi:unnamed protein product [Moneuplotes crassus]|uniref:SCP domain-containing protein n=1 Tax=Euplotes crassus TaxID=5936 RepID=A0AAD2D1H9_EUPCR|nr:unnamed protein product [Moneuplotes crassus]
MKNKEKFVKDFIQAHNKLRTDPQSFIPILEDYISRFEGTLLKRPGRANLRTNEGIPAFEEALEYLKTQEPVCEQTYSECLSVVAKGHAQDLGENNITGHYGSKGSTMQERIEKICRWEVSIGENISYNCHEGLETVVMLLVDDGVPDRSHRINIFKPKYECLGIGIYKHPKWKNSVVINYAGEAYFLKKPCKSSKVKKSAILSSGSAVEETKEEAKKVSKGKKRLRMVSKSPISRPAQRKLLKCTKPSTKKSKISKPKVTSKP